jgi:hypothetical protein
MYSHLTAKSLTAGCPYVVVMREERASDEVIENVIGDLLRCFQIKEKEEE